MLRHRQLTRARVQVELGRRQKPSLQHQPQRLSEQGFGSAFKPPPKAKQARSVHFSRRPLHLWALVGAPSSRTTAPPPRLLSTRPRVRRSPPRRLTIPARTRRWRPRRAASVGRGLRAARGQTCGASVSSGGSRRTSSACFGGSRRTSSSRLLWVWGPYFTRTSCSIRLCMLPPSASSRTGIGSAAGARRDRCDLV